MDKLMEGLGLLGLVFSEEQVGQLTVYAEKIVATPHNLTAIRDPDGIVIQHFLDSLVIMKYFELDYGKKFCDVGSGAGLPLLPLKILRPEMDATFIDSRQKSVDFLNEVIQSLGLKNCHTIHEHTTQMKEGMRYGYCLVRALGAADYILENCLFLLNSGGEIFMYKGPKHEEEIKKLPKRILDKISQTEILEVQVPFLDRKRFIVRMKKA